MHVVFDSYLKRIAPTFVAIFLSAGAAAATGGRPVQAVQDPHFGAVLFDFYQQRYFTAITSLTVAQQFDRFRHHKDEAELLLGGLYLSYGLHREAGDIFQRLIDQLARPEVRDRAWFYIAKIRYQRGYLEEAEQAMARIGGRLPGELDQEKRMLYAHILINAGKYKEAVRELKNAELQGEWAAYARYNLGVALVKAGEKELGLELLQSVGRMSVEGEELLALRDKANVALGYALLQDGTPARAKAHLGLVRLSGLLANKALLGMGWAHSAVERYEDALVPWLELQDRNAIDSAVQESLLAVPYAYGKLGAQKQSLDRYERAIAVYGKEIERLDGSIRSIKSGQMVANIMRRDSGQEMGWFWRLNDVPDAPESRYLLHLMAGHEFQEALKNYRDITFLLRHLKHWEENLDVFRTMSATRREAFAERLPRVLKGERAIDLPRYERLRNQFAAEVERIEREEDAAALATPRELALAERVANARAALKQAQRAPVDLEAARERLRIFAGILGFDWSSTFKPRLWDVKRSAQELDEALTSGRSRYDALQRARTDAPAGFDALNARMAALHRRVRELEGKLRSLAQAQESYLETLAVDELRQQQERLQSYITQARFAVAQIYDQAAQKPQGSP